MTAPAQPPLVVDVTYVARRAGLAVPVEDDQVAFVLEEAIRDRMVQVETYLGIPITPTRAVDTGRWANPGGWLLSREPVVEVISAVAETAPVTGGLTGTYTVTYTYGLDAAAGGEYEPIRRWVLAHSATHPDVRRLVRADPAASTGTKTVVSVSAEGQSVSYKEDAPSGGGGGAAGSGGATVVDPSGLPTLASLDRWRRANRRVYQRPTPPFAGWLGDMLP